MKLKRLEIQGFKSFADKTEIVFEQGTTAIVGPNGSGKSNISDAVRWVLGEQSAKQLRGARMEDVIFGGTEKRKPLSWCEVSLLFDNEDRALAMDCAEVMVTRRVWRSGESEYYLNRAACRLKDITELFRDTGIGKEGYSLIGQGRIEEILSSKSDDRREVFEEAAGIVTYRVRKEEAERRMENTRQNLERVEDILGELQNQLEPLEKQAEDARKYLALRDSLRDLELNAFLLQHDRLHERIAVLEEAIAALDAQMAEAEPRVQALGEEREKLNARADALAQEDGERSAQVLEAAARWRRARAPITCCASASRMRRRTPGARTRWRRRKREGPARWSSCDAKTKRTSPRAAARWRWSGRGCRRWNGLWRTHRRRRPPARRRWKGIRRTSCGR